MFGLIDITSERITSLLLETQEIYFTTPYYQAVSFDFIITVIIIIANRLQITTNRTERVVVVDQNVFI